MLPDMGWLNGHNHTRLFTIDQDNFCLYKASNLSGKSRAQEAVILVYSCPIPPSGLKQEHDILRCFALDHSADNYIAMGFNNGRIYITKTDVESSVRLARGEDIRDTHTQKNISCLSWHPLDSNKMCAAFERGRGVDHTLVVYDLNRASSKSSREPLAMEESFVNHQLKSHSYSTIFETNLSEKIFAVSWFHDDANLVVASTPRCLKLTDIRERSGFQGSINVATPQFGVCTEPTVGYLVASYSRNLVSVFDRRYTTHSVTQIRVGMDTQNVNKLAWRKPRNKAFSMACVNKDSGNFVELVISPKTFDREVVDKQGYIPDQLRQAIENRQHQYAPLIHSVSGFNKVISFDWHPNYTNKVALLLSSSSQQGTTKGIQITELVNDANFSINCDGDIAFTSSYYLGIAKKCTPIAQQQDEFAKLSHYFDQPDQAMLMKTRIKKGYGYGNTSNSLYTIIESSRNVIENDPCANEDIKFCWRWVHRMYHYPDDLQKTYLTRFPGVKHIIKDMKSSSTTRNDEITYRNRVFTNEKRETILRICGWPPFEDRIACKLMFDELINRPKVESKARACALAMLSVQGANSKEYLQRLCDFTHSDEFIEKNEKKFVERWKTMALMVMDVMNKFNGIKVPDYLNVCSAISDNYLLAIIKFLARREFYNTFLHEIISLESMDLEDKLAFAAIHMDDEQLNLALEYLLQELKDRRPLSALLITGLDDHNECHQMLHSFVEKNNDIQTASILFVVGNCFRKSKLLQDSSFTGVKISELLSKAIDAEERRNPRRISMHCVRDYMDILSNWCFWLPKTFLSSLLRVNRTNFADSEARTRLMSAQAVIACNFCGVPIYPSVSDKIESLRSNAAMNTIYNFPKRGDKTRMMSCAKCKRPLPKCTICRQHYGSQASASKPEFGATPEFPSKTSAIDHWFVWCCSCNHGGHLSHIRDWFQEYKACPASGCACLCMDKDRSLRDDLLLPNTDISH